MRPTTFRIVTLTAFSAALCALPSALPAATARHSVVRIAATPIEIAGSYELTIVNRQAKQHVNLILEETEAGYTGLMIIDGAKSALSDVQVIDESIHANVMTNAGRAAIVLHLSDKGVTGTLRFAKVSLPVSGERTN
ncbi:MAG: hypothetical protein ABJE10_20120 [bacterium]